MDQLHSTVATSNFSSPGPPSHHTLDFRQLFPAVMLSLCFILGVPGNIAVIILRPNWQHLSSLSQSLMLNLAVSDLICLLTLPLLIYSLIHGWTFSLVSCKLLASVVYCSTYCSLMTVTGLSIQRYLVVVHRLGCQQVPKRLVFIFLWVVALILSVPFSVVRQLEPDQNQNWTICRFQYSSDAWEVALLMMESVLGLVFFVIVAFSYNCIQRRINQDPLFNNPQTTRLLSSIIISLFVLWVPYHTINVLRVAAIGFNNEGLLNFCKDKRKIVVAVTFINSCLNPLLYAFTSRKIRNFCQLKESTQQMISIPETQEGTTSAEFSL